jgi:Tol biopolymer transport system component/DNA-binding winged helix-turn-helix (wHTH) protein
MNANVQMLRRFPDIRYARLAGCLIDVPANAVQRDGEDIRLTPKSMAVLRELMQRQGSVVRRDDLLGIVWRDGFPTDDVLTHAITELRRALNDDPRAPTIIETIPKVGYRLLATVEVLIESPTPLALGAIPPPTIPEVPPRVPWRLYASLAILALATIAIPAWRGAERVSLRVPAAGSVNADTSRPLRPLALTSDPSREQFPSLSPDGGTVVYAARSPESGMTRILLKSLDAAAVPVLLTDPRPPLSDDYPVWSPDGKQVAFLRFSSEDCAINVVPALGGPIRRIADCSLRYLDYIDWSADGKALLVARRELRGSQTVAHATIHRIDLETGVIDAINYGPQPRGEDDLQPRASPDGRWIAFRRGAAPYSDLFVMPVEGGTAQRITALNAMIRGYAWMPDSNALVISSDHAGEQALFMLGRDGQGLTPLGVTRAHFPAISRRAPVLVYQQENSLTQLAAYTLGSHGEVGPRLAIAPSSRSDHGPALSPSGARLAFVSLRSGAPQLWVSEIDSGLTFPLTDLTDRTVDQARWSPDERALLFISRGAGASTLMRVELASRRIETLSEPGERVRFASFARDGKSIFLSSDRSGTWQVWRMWLADGRREQLTETGGWTPQQFGDDDAIYYIKETDRGLFRLDLGAGKEARVSWMAGYWNMNMLHVAKQGLYFIDFDDREGNARVMRAPFLSADAARVDSNAPIRLAASANDADVGDQSELEPAYALPSSSLRADASFAADLSRVVVVEVMRDETDLMSAALHPVQGAR